MVTLNGTLRSGRNSLGTGTDSLLPRVDHYAWHRVDPQEMFLELN